MGVHGDACHDGQAGAPQTGTTIVACTYPGGVVLGADGRVSVGRYVSNRASNKIAPLSDNTFLLRSGSAPDTQAIADYVRFYVENLTSELGREPDVVTVANLVMQMNYNNKHLVGATIVAGWDKAAGGQVFGCPIGGTLIPEKWTTDGSGSTYIWGYMDAAFREDFTRAEAEAFVKEAIGLAMSRDGSSGGIMRLVTVDESGAHTRYIQGAEVPLFGDDLPYSAQPAGPSGMVVG